MYWDVRFASARYGEVWTMAEREEVGRMPRADARRSRERILAAARPLLEENSRATMAEVAAAAGRGGSPLHRPFATRLALVRALEDAAGGAEDVPERAPAELLPAGRLGRAAP